jgi:ABC-type bacteriocin/lantibiotic exporter with double-glycine peptidase domain
MGISCIRLLIVKTRKQRKTPKPSRIKITLTRMRLFFARMKTRTVIANIMMVLFILLTSMGMFMYSPALGLVVAGVCCGIFGFLLGLE